MEALIYNTCEIIQRYVKSTDRIHILNILCLRCNEQMNWSCSGEIIGIINSDDWYLKNAIKTVEEEFNKHPDIDILYSSIQK